VAEGWEVKTLMMRPARIVHENQNILTLDQCLAKTVKIANDTLVKGVSVSTHCQVVGHVAKELVGRQPRWLRDALFPSGSDLVAACHDVGKVSPHFQEKIHSAIDKKAHGIGNSELDSTLGGHAAVSQACLTGIAAKPTPEILGRHHGYAPTSLGKPNDQNYGGPAWQQTRMDLVAGLKREFATEWPAVANEFQANVLSGLTCVADWIGSGTLFDGVCADGTLDPEPWSDRVVRAVDSAGFVGFAVQPDLSFNDVFGFEAREAQEKLIQAADQPGVYVLEAPMGMGKTEAALYAAYRALARGTATGIYFALPTQLTSEKIHDRMNAFLARVLAEDCKFRSLLLHSSAWLRDTELGEEGMPGHGWFNSAKRGLLAPFAVGTIDQALMGVMNVKHGFVRTFGLAGKVVILDEVHSYDSFTGTIMQKLVQALRELHCTVIILSATLTAERRGDLLGEALDEAAYPLVSAVPKGKPAFCRAVTQTDTAAVDTTVKHDDCDALEQAIRRAERGEQVLWVENIVAQAQDRFRTIAARAQACGTKIECGLLHSRFQRADRATNEEKWVRCFGKGGYDKRGACGRILVGTQVLEQSLDIDADFLVTRLCPTDMLFQRIGRLWRHREADGLRPTAARREAWILAPELEESRNDTRVWGKTGKVYMPYVLYRTLSVWERKGQVSLPQEIRPMLEATYAEQVEGIEVLMKCKEDVRKTRARLEALARIGLSTGGPAHPESKATTRYSEMESCEVLLIRKKILDDTGTTVTLLNGDALRLPKAVRREERGEWRRLAAKFQQNVVMVPEYLAPSTPRRHVKWLEEYVYLGDWDESPFRVALVTADGTLSGVDGGTALDGYELKYTSTSGYSASKRNDDSPADVW